MSASEFQRLFGNVTSENFSETTTKWLQFPVYTELPTNLLARIESISTLRGAVKAFTEQHGAAAQNLVKENKHFEAIGLLNQRFRDAERIFMADDLTTALMFVYRRRGRIKHEFRT